MGSGNSVALEAADMILMNNNFSYIVDSIENGRLVFDNLKKTICFYLPASVFCQITSTVMNMFLGSPVIYSSFQLISDWLCHRLDTKLEFHLWEKRGKSSEPKAEVEKRPFSHAYASFSRLDLHRSPNGFLSDVEHLSFTWTGTAVLVLPDFFLQFDQWKDGYMNYSANELDDILSGAQTAGYLAIISIQLCKYKRKLQVWISCD